MSFPILFSCCYWKKKNWSWWFSVSLQISFHSLEKTSSSKSRWNQDSYWPLRRKVRGQGLPCVYRRAPQKILSYNSEDYTSSDFFFSSHLLGWPKVSSGFHLILYWKTWTNFWVNPIYSWSLKEQRQQAQPISLCPELVGVLREPWPTGSLNTSVQRIRHCRRPVAFLSSLVLSNWWTQQCPWGTS